MGAIIGNQNPKVGETNFYEINIFSSLPFFNPSNSYEWYLFKKQKNSSWIDITKDGTPKKGTKVTYQFFEPVAGELFEMRVFEVAQGLLPSSESSKKLFGKLEVTPTASRTAQIDKVTLFNRGNKDVNKADYRDVLVAQAFCTALFGKEIEFQLWEDDAKGEGHNAAVNKNNKIPRIYRATVNEKGIAEVKISLSTDEKIMREIANKYLMKGDADEGANHEYYVTANYLGKSEKSSQVNVLVANPNYKPKAKPKTDSAKFPATPSSTTQKQPDKEGKILDAFFVNDKGEKLSKIKLNDSIKVRISSQNMKGKTVQYIIWEYDTAGHDEILRKNLVLNYDTGDSPPIKIDASIFAKGYGTDRTIFGSALDSDSVTQNYFIEVIPLDVSAKSQKFGVTSDGLMEVEKVKSVANVKENKAAANNCGGKFCIKKGDKNELIREINIKLSGFGGNVPIDEFTDRTEKMVKQFQRDYMKIPETGKICGNVLKSIDEFCNRWSEKVINYKCLCHASDSKVKQADRCPGYGKGLKNEHPGVHRSLMWGVSALKYYLSLQTSYKYRRTSAGYRCWAHNKSVPRTSTNHMGKAIDIQFDEGTYQINGKVNRNLKPLRGIRDNFYIKYLKAEEGWTIPSKNNNYRLEPIGTGKDQSYSWIHMDVALFENSYLKDEYFTKEQNAVTGKSVVALANELGYKDVCSCMGGAKTAATVAPATPKKEGQKGKWSHSEFGNMIAQFESSDDYNICNRTELIEVKVKGKTKTKRVVRVVRDVKVVDLTVKEIQDKQEDKSLFAVGRYQLIPNTFNGAIASLGLAGNVKMSQETQDKIFDEYLIKVKRPKIIAYLEGDGTVEDAMYTSAMEWASIGVEKGKRISDKKTKVNGKTVTTKRYAAGGESYYADDGLNNAHITPEQIKNALINSKNANK